MCTQMEQIDAMTRNITLAETWLKQMGRAADRLGLDVFTCTYTCRVNAVYTTCAVHTRLNSFLLHRYNLKLQYCMTLPREIMAALEIPAVSHVSVHD